MTREIGISWLIQADSFMKWMTALARGRSAGFVVIVSLSLFGCTEKGASPMFKLLSPDETGVKFANSIRTSDSLNVQTDVYLYNGAGVAVGDIDNDGLPDIFFSGNMVSSRLYLNKGHMRFEDITDRARVGTRQWATGATMVDINDDGFLDIYVSVSGPGSSTGAERANRLYINNHNRTFTEAAAQYGIADTSFTTHAVFLDYDGDGCLDLFLLNNSPKDFSRSDVSSHPSGMRGETPGSHNELYHNDCKGKFTNMSEQAGILRDAGYGLGVAVADLNGDGRPDIYVSNDAAPNDVLYVNNGDGTFTNKAGEWLKHSSYAGMGVDIADFNNDGWPDIMQADMMPRDLSRRKRMSGFTTFGGVLDARSRGFRQDYSENSLQLSNGVTSGGDIVFSEIARLAGVSHTDWSWSALFADFDNDGYKDIFIGNGYPKAVNDLDYVNATMAASRPGSSSASRKQSLDMLRQLPAYDESNYFFRNTGDLTFADETKESGLERPSFSYGAAYVDLDNDGKLDLVVNNIDAPAFIYQNVLPPDSAHHFLTVVLAGDSPNRRGIGAKLILTAGGKKQYLYHSPYRGFMSTVDEREHFGLGALARADSLEVVWPDGRRQVLTGVAADRTVVVKQSEAILSQPTLPAAPRSSQQTQPFQLIDSRKLAYVQPPASMQDYGVQPLLPYMISSHGPARAVGDVDGDGLDDVYIGGGAGVAGELFIQRKDGSFVKSAATAPWDADKAYDDWGALFFDANGDGLNDLYVASGGYALAPDSPLLQDRLYINKGHGTFVRDSAALPAMLTSTATVRSADFDGDGRPDLFVGGRLAPRSYPAPARSYVLHNAGGGHFTDVTDKVAPDLAKPIGMITDALWIDFDGDGRTDLVTAGEWMPIDFYHNDGNRLRNVTAATGLGATNGWWYSLASADLDHDGRPDIVAGNLGLNYTYTASSDHPFGIYAGDYTGNRTTDIVLTEDVNGTEYPHAGMVPLGREIYTLALKFPTYGAFSNASIKELFTPEQLRQSVHYRADTFASLFLHNAGGGKFTATRLPNEAQISPIRGIIAHDVDGDGKLDLIVAGNLYDAEPNTARADAGNGLWLKGDGRGAFTAVPPRESGFLAPRDVSGLAILTTANGKAVLVANTADSLQLFSIRK